MPMSAIGNNVRRNLLKRNRAEGFSLIEILAVIVLIAIVLTAVSFSFSKSLSGARIQAASRDLVAALRYTRGQAIVKGKEQTLELNLENNSYQAPNRAAVFLPKDMQLRLLTASNELTSEHSGRIRFYRDGSSTGGHISVITGEREWRINVNWLTGEVVLMEQGR